MRTGNSFCLSPEIDIPIVLHSNTSKLVREKDFIVYELLNLQVAAPVEGALSLPARAFPSGPVMEARAPSPRGLLLPFTSAVLPRPRSSLAAPPRSAAMPFESGTTVAPAPAPLDPIVVPRPLSISPALGPESGGLAVSMPLAVSGHALPVPSPAPAPGPQGNPSQICHLAFRIT
jgi:hypothetical protein